LLNFVASIGWLGAHILGGSLYLAWATGADVTAAKVAIALGFGVFIIIGGYTAVVWTDALQALVLFAGFLLMAAAAVMYAGGWESIRSSMDPAALSLLGVEKLGLVPVISLAAVIGVGVLATPSYRQRIYSARDVSAVRRSFTISGVLYLLFAALPAVIGMAAYAIDPELENHNFAFPFVAATVLPGVPAMMVLIAGLSATMSSASSDAIAGVSILLRDVYAAWTGSMPASDKVVRYSRLALVAVIAMALGLALTSDDIITYISGMIATVMSGLFVCSILGRFWRRFTWQGAIAALAAGSAASTGDPAEPGMAGFLGQPVHPVAARLDRSSHRRQSRNAGEHRPARSALASHQQGPRTVAWKGTGEA
jgi:solute:Na+ symporter, SSS family